MVFIKAKTGPPSAGDSDEKFTVHYFDEQGNVTIMNDGKLAKKILLRSGSFLECIKKEVLLLSTLFINQREAFG